MSRRTQVRRQAGPPRFGYGAFTLSRGPSQSLPLRFGLLPAGLPGAALQPRGSRNPRFGLLPFRSPLLGESRLDFLSCWYLDGSLPSVSRACTILFMHARQSSRLAGYPIRTSGLRRIFAPTPGFSQLVTSFFAWQLLGILRGPFLRLTILSFPFPSLIHVKKPSGGRGTRTPDTRLAKPVL